MLELTNARGDRVQVAAERGGKITSLRGAGGREWLAQTELLDRSPSGLDFVAAEMSGWDECAPSIDPGELDGVRFSDHGDLWDRPWTVLDAAEVIELEVDGLDYPYLFRRRIRPVATGFEFDYAVENRDRVPRPMLWAAHPQFIAEPGTRVRLGNQTAVVPVDAPERPAIWQSSRGLVPGTCGKWWTLPGQLPEQAELVHPDGAVLRLSWAGDAVSCVGIWLDGGVYAAGSVLALEPATGWYDSAARAAQAGQVLVLEPGEQAAWTISVGLSEPEPVQG